MKSLFTAEELQPIKSVREDGNHRIRTVVCKGREEKEEAIRLAEEERKTKQMNKVADVNAETPILISGKTGVFLNRQIEGWKTECSLALGCCSYTFNNVHPSIASHPP